ncbi:unnamed protein product, partial [Cyprideis torosa]
KATVCRPCFLEVLAIHEIEKELERRKKAFREKFYRKTLTTATTTNPALVNGAYDVSTGGGGPPKGLVFAPEDAPKEGWNEEPLVLSEEQFSVISIPESPPAEEPETCLTQSHPNGGPCLPRFNAGEDSLKPFLTTTVSNELTKEALRFPDAAASSLLGGAGTTATVSPTNPAESILTLAVPGRQRKKQRNIMLQKFGVSKKSVQPLSNARSAAGENSQGTLGVPKPQCEICGKYFTSRKTLWSHRQRHQPF